MPKLLQEGDSAPSYKGITQNGTLIQPSDFKGKTVVLYFYPKDDTPGCTQEACAFRDEYKLLQKKGVQVIGVSADSAASHQKFTKKYDLPFPLIADEDKTIVQAYGVWVEKNMYGRKYMGIERSTFIINSQGAIKKIFRKVKPAQHLAEVIEALD